mmetsp:Transcript_8086/g.11882  ORF Transcript_8086/g.11882 Transcript_8086/m.11882 type:complete len:217 (-) Transcript_8086:171-821(-)|eukprot:CAMPEP_0173107026 /NCGR_PEP_ID=MMETSP1102-20130122/41484_1 /TAXON_ID=49646 /ORGANISM="Geminigera sp., Strain Caron Lab Isolate" /LENGTH=216 /DNA_ID=CAMNT_0014004441 /DNA_START=171 /DNA_END=821 /DNA_ORIENTATION=+
MFFSKGITLESKNLALSEIPRMMETGGEACKPDNAIIFNVGVLDVQSLPGFSNGDAPVVISLALLADGYHTQLAQTSTVGKTLHSKQVAKGFTFALDVKRVDTAMLRLQVSSGNKVLLEKSIPVRTLRYTGKTYFDETIFFGGSLQLEGRARNHTKIPTVKMAFELLSLGDGNYFRRHNPQFSVVEIARMENELQAAPHPLNLAAHPVADAPVGMA